MQHQNINIKIQYLKLTGLKSRIFSQIKCGISIKSSAYFITILNKSMQISYINPKTQCVLNSFNKCAIVQKPLQYYRKPKNMF